MKTHRKTLCILLALVMAFMLLAGCDGSNGEIDDPEDDYNSENTNPGFSPSDGLDENGYWIGVTALDYVVLPDYHAIRIPNEVHQVSEASIQELIDDILFDFIIYEEIFDRAVVDGDTVNIDYVGSIDGVEFENGSTEGMGTIVTIGVDQYIDDFLEQLIGHMPGDTFDVEVTFPDYYPNNPDFEGLDAVFVTTVNYIGGDEIMPELTDDFVMENLSFMAGWETVEDMRNEITLYLQTMKEEEVWQFLYEYLYENTVILSIPDPILNYTKGNMINYYEQGAISEGVELEELLSWYGHESMDELVDFYWEDIEREATFSLILQAIAEDSGISAGRDEVIDHINENFGDFSSLEEEYGLPMLAQYLLNQKVFDYIFENVVYL